MSTLSNVIQSADWKSEKHVPVIESPDEIQADEMFDVSVTLGQEVAHPNTTAHHIRWVSLYFQPEGAKAPQQVAHFEFCAHGESTQGADEGPVYTHHGGTVTMKTSRSGTLQAVAYCNIHGVWESSKDIRIA